MNRAGYRNIFKGTAVFGGTQIINTFVNILRGKAVAVLIGSAGMGINALYSSSIGLISTISSFGLNISAVRDIARAKDQNDERELSYRISVLHKCFIITCLLGFCLTIMASPILSVSAFHDYSHIWQFSFLSLMVIFTLLGQECTCILQGLHLLKKTAYSSMFSNLLSLFTSITLYYYWGIDGIIYNLVIASIISFIIKYWYIYKLKIKRIEVLLWPAIKECRTAFSLGIVIVIGSVVGNLVTMVINMFISSYGSINDVGYYSAAVAITSQALGLVFASMGADYFPKLAVACKDSTSMNHLVNAQGEIVTLIALPITVLMMFLSGIIIQMLLTQEFNVVNDFIRYVCVALLVQAMYFPLGYITFAKGDKQLFFILEVIIGNVLQISCKLCGYYYGGLNGLAISFFINNLLCMVITSTVVCKKYHFRFSKEYLKIIFGSILLSFASLYTCMFFPEHIIWIDLILITATIVYSIYGLNKRISIL